MNRVAAPADTVPIDRSVLYEHTIFRMNDRSLHAGRFMGLRGDSLLVLEQGEVRQFPLARIDTLEVLGVRGSSWKAGVVGACFGAYLGTALLGAAEGQPFAYQDWEDLTYIAVAAGFAGVGYGLFSVLGGDAQVDYDFTFTGDQEHRLREQQQFLDFVSGIAHEPKFHARVFGGSINTRQSDASGATWQNFNVGMGEGSQVNLFRSIDLTLTVNDWLEAGGSIVNLSEPSYALGGFVFSNSASVYATYSESFEGNLFAALGSADPLRSSLPDWLRWKVRGGIGLAGLQLQSAFYSSAAPADPFTRPFRETRLDKTTVGFLVGTSVEAFLFRGLSLGVGVDYAICPGAEFPAVPEFGLDSKPISNICLGFTFGIHL